MSAPVRRLTLLGGILFGGNLGMLVLARSLRGPAEAVRQFVAFCNF